MFSNKSWSNQKYEFQICITDDDSEYNYIPGIYPDFETEKAETTNSEHDVDDLRANAHKNRAKGGHSWKPNLASFWV